ncbi:hypothetical protein DL98DRAFT_643909, partial [Cadophora sp. DSE1049]
SHVQVVKAFLRDHPGYERLFPRNNKLEDSFKNDPCLKALSEGHLPRKMVDHYTGQVFDLPGENLSSVPISNTNDSDSILVNHTGTNDIDYFFCNSHVSQSRQWLSAKSFDSDPAWANYTVLWSTPAIGWDFNEAKNHVWPDLGSLLRSPAKGGKLYRVEY